jgi:hypothetical protein
LLVAASRTGDKGIRKPAAKLVEDLQKPTKPAKTTKKKR